MRLGQPTLAPRGFVEFCRREPQECGATNTTPQPPAGPDPRIAQALAATAQPAALAATPEASPVITAAIDDTVNLRSGATLMKLKGPAPHGALVDWSRALRKTYFTLDIPPAPELGAAPHEVTASAVTRIDLSDAMAQLQRMKASGAVTASGRTRLVAGPLHLTPALWKQIGKVNDKINGSLAQRSDMEIYGVSEAWALPLENGVRAGDCEDFALEKRHALLAQGVPRSALSLAVVITPQGFSHAVLLVSTDQGEYVLDSLTPWILPWQKTGYQWRERQVAGSTSSWAMVAGPAPATSGDRRILLASAR